MGMHDSIQEISSAVQKNCHIADARHGGDYTMCTYLLKMREFFRWEQGVAFTASLPKNELGDWLSAREALWEELGESDFALIRVGEQAYDPFATEAINKALEPLGMVYSAGLINGAKPHFFLGELLHKEEQGEDFVLHISDRELARCLNAPPAMTSGQGIFLRRESLRRYLWEKYETWCWNRPQNALGRAIAGYGFDKDAEVALESMTENEMESARQHELGEYQAGQILGDAWNMMLVQMPFTRAELMARAVRDHLADCLCTLPELLDRDCDASIHFFLGNLSGMRKHLFPSLDTAYNAWLDAGDKRALLELADRGRDHWSGLAGEILDMYRDYGSDATGPIADLVEGRKL